MKNYEQVLIKLQCHDSSNTILPMNSIGNRLGTKRKLSTYKIMRDERNDGWKRRN